jgi:putative glutathione S-transferase
MLNSAFTSLTGDRADYYPPELRAEIDRTNARVYRDVNIGVYRAGFATTQEAYEDACREVFAALDWLEALLQRQRYLVGARLTEADWRLFTTLVRFDSVYYSHFKCNLRRIADYYNLCNYLRDLYQVPGIADTVNGEHGSHQATLLREYDRHQSNRYRAAGAGIGFCRVTRSRPIRTAAKRAAAPSLAVAIASG